MNLKVFKRIYFSTPFYILNGVVFLISLYYIMESLVRVRPISGREFGLVLLWSSIALCYILASNKVRAGERINSRIMYSLILAQISLPIIIV